MRLMLAQRTMWSSLFWVGVFVAIVIVLWFIFESQPVQERILDWKEDYAYAKNPSAELAYEIGTEHLSSSVYPQYYDINRATYFFNLALMQDPNLPYIWHQLARIAFLTGNFPAALAYINIQINQEGDKTPPSYYVRGLIEGYQGDYADAEKDYAHFLQLKPVGWAGYNDYAWVLLKDNKPQLALQATQEGLRYYPENPWLLNSEATAQYELGDVNDARTAVLEAQQEVAKLTPQEWSMAYPGNSPDIASEGLATFGKAVTDNMHMILASTTVSS